VPPTSTTTTLPCPPDGFAGLRCVLANGLGRSECAGESFARRRVRRFERVLHLIDRAQAAHHAAKTRHLLERTARYLGKLHGGVERDGGRAALSAGCVTAVEAILADGQMRAQALALDF
jgi:hypothetical protein